MCCIATVLYVGQYVTHFFLCAGSEHVTTTWIRKLMESEVEAHGTDSQSTLFIYPILLLTATSILLATFIIFLYYRSSYASGAAAHCTHCLAALPDPGNEKCPGTLLYSTLPHPTLFFPTLTLLYYFSPYSTLLFLNSTLLFLTLLYSTLLFPTLLYSTLLNSTISHPTHVCFYVC
jgi:hypothetical protein